MHEHTAGNRNTLSRNQQLHKTGSFSANAIADRVNVLAGGTQRQLKETCVDVVACSVAIDGVQALQPSCGYLVSFEATSQLELPACPGNLRTGPFERKNRA